MDFKKIISLILSFAFILTLSGCFAATDTPGVTEPSIDTSDSAAKDTEKSKKPVATDPPKTEIPEEDESMLKTIKILAIGNSFSVDGMEYLWNILKDGGYDKVVLGNLYIGGCSLNTHWSKISSDSSAYTYYKNTAGAWTTKTGVSVSKALKEEKWDIITVQQASGSSGIASSYGNLQNILDYVNTNKTNPDAKIMWHLTWAYSQDSGHQDFSKYNKDQMTMYNAIISAYKSEVMTKSDISGLIPSGTAMQNLRTSYYGDTVDRDGYHLNEGFGRYAAGLTWYAAITGNSLENIDWVPSSYPNIKANLPAIKESVANAISTPLAITPSTFNTIPVNAADSSLFSAANLDINNYEQLSLSFTVAAFYDSRKFHTLDTTNSIAPNYSATQKLTRAQLPVGSVIIVDSGYQYRPDAWIDGSTLTSSGSRPAAVSTNFVKVTEAWWGSFTIRGFNLFHTGANTAMTSADSVHLRIYIPKSTNS